MTAKNAKTEMPEVVRILDGFTGEFRDREPGERLPLGPFLGMDAEGRMMIVDPDWHAVEEARLREEGEDDDR